MIRYFRALLATLQAIATTLEAAHGILSTGIRQWTGIERFEDRLSTLERELDKREAQAEATLERAESKFKSARAAEERARYHAQSAGRADESDEDGDDDEAAFHQYLESLRNGHAAGGPEEGMHPMPSGVGSRSEQKARLRAQKLGRA